MLCALAFSAFLYFFSELQSLCLVSFFYTLPEHFWVNGLRFQRRKPYVSFLDEPVRIFHSVQGNTEGTQIIFSFTMCMESFFLSNPFDVKGFLVQVPVEFKGPCRLEGPFFVVGLSLNGKVYGL